DWIVDEYNNQGSPSTFHSSGVGAPTITAVYVSSLTVSYTTAAGSQGYELDASTASSFTGTVISSSTTSGSLGTLSFNFGSLNPDTTYFIRIGSIVSGATTYNN